MYTVQSDNATTPRRAAWIAMILALIFAAGCGGNKQETDKDDSEVQSDFDLVSRDALGFVTVRVADALETKPIQKMKDSFVQAAGRDGARAMQQLSEIEDAFGLKLSDIERVTIVIGGDPDRGNMWFLVRTKKDIDKDRILKFIEKIDTYEEKKHEGKTYYVVGKRGEGAVSFLSSRLAVVAPVPGMEKCLEVAKNGPGKGPLEDSIKLASGDKYHAVAAGNFADILKNPEARKNIERGAKRPGPEGDLAKMVLSLKTVVYSVRIDKKLSIDLTAEFDSADAAKQAVAAVESGIQLARKEIPAEVRQKPEMKPLIEAMDQIKPKTNGSTVTVSVELDSDPLVTAMLFLLKGDSPREPDRQPESPKRQPPQPEPSQRR